MTISINKPTVGGSENTWGTTINTALDDVVDVLNGNTASTPDLTAGSWKVGGTAVTADAAEINKLDGFTGDAADLNYAKDLRATGVTTAEFDKLDGLTASTSELNKMDGVTATTAELNYTDGVSSNIQTQLNGKASTSRTISAGGGLTGGGNLTANRTISHYDTSSQGSVNNGGNTVIQDISLDGYGHVTSIGSKALSIPSGNTLSTSNKAWTDGSGGLQIRYGSFSSSTDGDQYVNFTSAFSNSCFVCIVGGEVLTKSVSRTNFLVNREDSYSGTITFQYIALGN